MTMKGQSHQLKMSSPSIMTGIGKKERIGIWRVNECSLSEAVGVHPPFQVVAVMVPKP